jgi:hypothetical protein
MNQSTDCWYCGVPFGGKSHPDVYACVKAVNEELYRTVLQLSEAERKGRDLCCALGENLILLLDIRKDLKEHGLEYKHVTPPELLARLEAAITPTTEKRNYEVRCSTCKSPIAGEGARCRVCLGE